MDFIYAPPPPPKKKLDLPTHLPNSVPVALDIPSVDVDAEDDEKTYIPGTTISLETDEDIAQWIEQRKKNWPTNKRVREKELQTALNPPPEASAKRQKVVCRFYQQHKKCKFGNKCKNLHGNDSKTPSSFNTVKVINGVSVSIPKRYANEMYHTNASLYKMLVQKDLYQHENNLVIDFIKYLDQHNMINEINEQ